MARRQGDNALHLVLSDLSNNGSRREQLGKRLG
jgi:hypothetical protein